MKFNYAHGHFNDHLKSEIETRIGALFDDKFPDTRVQKITCRLEHEKYDHDTTLTLDFNIPGYKNLHFSHHMPYGKVLSDDSDASTFIEGMRSKVKRSVGEKILNRRTRQH